jgi:hypothetical protein
MGDNIPVNATLFAQVVSAVYAGMCHLQAWFLVTIVLSFI